MSNYNFKNLTSLVQIKTGKLNSNAAVIGGKFPFFTCSPQTLAIDFASFNTEAILLAGNNAEGNFSIKYYKGQFNAYQRTYIIEAKENVYLKYIFYAIKEQLKELKNVSVGSATRFLTMDILDNLLILLPEFEVQESIAEVLSSLDDKIDLLQQNNKTLEQLAETLFRQWFVEEAEDSWEVSTIGNQFITKGGGTPSTTDPTLWDGNIFWTSPRDLSYNSKLFMSRTSRTISSIGLKKISSGLLPKGTVLLSSRAPIGYLAITNVELAINQGYIACIPNDNYSSWFIHNWLKNNMELIQSSSNGSTFMEISKSVFRELEFIVPPTRVLNKYNRVCENFYNKILANEKQIEQLEFLHDTLLPKLMSGTVRVIN